MRLNAPTQPIWLIAVIVGILGIAGHYVVIPYVTLHSFWFVTVGFAMLVLGTMMKGL